MNFPPFRSADPQADYAGRTDLDFDQSGFVAGGVVCWDLQRQDWAWTVHLDLTTDRSEFKALIKVRTR
jgi:hypothetical protein